MKRPNTTGKGYGWGEDTQDKNEKFKNFLKDFTSTVNEGTHDDLERAEDYLERHELDKYIDPEGLNMEAIEQNEDLSVRDVIEIAIHWARHTTHKNWHEVMDYAAKKHGIPIHDHDEDDDDEPGIQVVTDPSQLPAEVLEALRGVIGEALEESATIKDKKPRGKK